MTPTGFAALLIGGAIIAAVFAFIWPSLPNGGKQAMAMYAVSYGVTYCIGGLWIGATDGEILSSYFRDRLYIPSVIDLGGPFWILLIGPLIVPILIVAILTRRSRYVPLRTPAPACGSAQFVVAFAALAGYAVFRIFHDGYAVVQALTNLTTLYGDTASIVESRLQLFGAGTGAAFGILYSGLPALCHVALFQSRAVRSWRVIAAGATLVSLTLLLATFQIAPAAVFVLALVMSAAHLGLLRMTVRRGFVIGIAFVLLLQGLNGWKFGEWTFFENLRHLVFRMPAAFPYYLSCFSNTAPFLGTDWIGALTGSGADPGSPFVVARCMYPDALAGSAMAAPAHVQAYAEGGVLNGVLAIVALGGLIAAVSRMYPASKESAIWHALYVQGLVAVYYATQTSFRGVIWHSYGFVWSLGALACIAALSWRPAMVRIAAGRPPSPRSNHPRRYVSSLPKTSS